MSNSPLPHLVAGALVLCSCPFLVRLPLPSRDTNTLFRGNSLASKVIDEFMKLVGKMYLQRTLQGCIDEVLPRELLFSSIIMVMD